MVSVEWSGVREVAKVDTYQAESPERQGFDWDPAVSKALRTVLGV